MMSSTPHGSGPAVRASAADGARSGRWDLTAIGINQLKIGSAIFLMPSQVAAHSGHGGAARVSRRRLPR